MENKIDPFAFIDPSVLMGKGNVFTEGVIIRKGVKIGDNNYFGPYTIIGEQPEKIGTEGNEGVIIGDNNTFYKQVTVDSGTEVPTYIGDDNYFLKNSHVGHDARISNECRLSCNVCIGGFTAVLDNCVFGLNSSVHQRSHIGKGTYLGANSFLKGVVAEYGIWGGVPARFIRENEYRCNS